MCLKFSMAQISIPLTRLPHMRNSVVQTQGIYFSVLFRLRRKRVYDLVKIYYE